MEIFNNIFTTRKIKNLFMIVVITILVIIVMPISASATDATEIDLLSTESCVHVGELPTPHVATHDDNCTVDSVKWVYYDTSTSAWKEFTSTPTAVDDGTKYGLKVTTKLDDGYSWASTVKITYNGTTSSSLSRDVNIVYVDLGTVNDRQPVKFELNISDIGTDKTPNNLDALMSDGTNNDFNTYAINGSGMYEFTDGFVPTSTTTVTEMLNKTVSISKTDYLENKLYLIGFGVNFKIGCDPTMENSIIKINGTNAILGESDLEETFGVYYIVDLRIKHNVTFNANGHGTAPTLQVVAENDKVTKPTDLTAAGYTFGGWYVDEKCTIAYDFDKGVSDDITLYAKWTETEEVAQTGDNSAIGAFVALTAFSAAGYVTLKKYED